MSTVEKKNSQQDIY